MIFLIILLMEVNSIIVLLIVEYYDRVKEFIKIQCTIDFNVLIIIFGQGIRYKNENQKFTC